MNKIFGFLVITLFSFKLFSQECLHSDLSKTYNFKTTVTKSSSDLNDSITISLEINSKTDPKLKQLITFKTGYLFEDAFTSCTNTKSYFTGTNLNLEVADNDYGDLIIEDFNFDGLEDFAIKNNSGGNGGPTYAFYMQQNNKIFKRDEYLTNTMYFYPTEINKKKKTLTILVHASAISYSETTFIFNSKNKKWLKLKSKIVNL